MNQSHYFVYRPRIYLFIYLYLSFLFLSLPTVVLCFVREPAFETRSIRQYRKEVQYAIWMEPKELLREVSNHSSIRRFADPQIFTDVSNELTASVFTVRVFTSVGLLIL